MLFSLKWAKEPIFTNSIKVLQSGTTYFLACLFASRTWLCPTVTQTVRRPEWEHPSGNPLRTFLPPALISLLFKAASRARRRVPHRAPPVNPCCTQAGVLFWNENQCFSESLWGEKEMILHFWMDRQGGRSVAVFTSCPLRGRAHCGWRASGLLPSGGLACARACKDH